jgi:hypothetical protein
VTFCEKPYLPKATLPVDDMISWEDVVGQSVPYINMSPPLEVKVIPLFELDIFDSVPGETVMKMIEGSADEAGGLHRLAIMANSGYQINCLCLPNLY